MRGPHGASRRRWLPWRRGRSGGDEATPLGGAIARDEELSAYLDGQLEAAARAGLERRLERDPALRAELEGMSVTREGLRALGLAAPRRSFTINASQVPRRRGLPRLELATRLATMAAAVALVAVLAGPSMLGMETDTLTSASSRDAAAPLGSMAELSKATTATDAAGAALEGAQEAPEPAPPAAPGLPSSAPSPAQEPGAAAPLRANEAPLEGAGSKGGGFAGEPTFAAGNAPAPDNASDSALGGGFWAVQVGVAVATALLATASGAMWLRRRARGVFRGH